MRPTRVQRRPEPLWRKEPSRGCLLLSNSVFRWTHCFARSQRRRDELSHDYPTADHPSVYLPRNCVRCFWKVARCRRRLVITLCRVCVRFLEAHPGPGSDPDLHRISATSVRGCRAVAASSHRDPGAPPGLNGLSVDSTRSESLATAKKKISTHTWPLELSTVKNALNLLPMTQLP